MGILLTKLRTTRGVRADFSNDVFPGTVHGSLGQARSPVQVELASGRLNNVGIMAQTVSKRKNWLSNNRRNCYPTWEGWILILITEPSRRAGSVTSLDFIQLKIARKKRRTNLNILKLYRILAVDIAEAIYKSNEPL